MPYQTRIPLAGSDRKPVPGAKELGPVSKDEVVRTTVVLRRRGADPEVSGEHHSRQEYGVLHGAAPADLDAIERFAHQHGLTVEQRNAAGRSVVLAGTAEAMGQAFGTSLASYELPHGRRFRGRTGPVMIPNELKETVIAVLGLDNRPVAKPHLRRGGQATPAGAFTPVQVADLYSFPSGVKGTGQTIAILELGGGYRNSDLRNYFQQLGMTAPAVAAVSVDGGRNTPDVDPDSDGEVMLDIEVAGAVAPGAKLAVYFAPNSDQGFHDAIVAAAHDAVRKPSILSISWGGPENTWTDQARTAMNAALEDAAAMGVTVTVAAGDDGATDGSDDNSLQVDFPAASPYVLSCGGTKLVAAAAAISDEEVWNELNSDSGATGGGVSRLYAIPTWQKTAGVPKHPDTGFAGRGVPDVAGDADPLTGYMTRTDGQDGVIGGTSAVAPLWAGLIALLNQQLGRTLGFANPLLYQKGTGAFHDIVNGNNGHYDAGKGWDACTGLGSQWRGFGEVTFVTGPAERTSIGSAVARYCWRRRSR
jgi:kumamolisin